MKIVVKDVKKTYKQGNIVVEALKPCNFEINDGEQIAITGTSGSGKSTLLHLLGGLEQATDGSIKYGDTDFSKMSQNQRDDFRLEHIGVVFQSFNLLPELTAYENIILPLMLQNKNIDDKYVDKLIERLELKDRMNHLPGQLSGGQQQRVALARALINRPSLLLCDEPTGNLDKKTTQSVMELLFDMSKEYSVTLLVVTHDENIAKRFSRVITISDGILGGDI
ncbi:ABC transporter ATP-binding protein [Pseudoruminococcus massiliensis]|uniref:ABC transporter ATP-binding protein n=1 Tax=Pseudoruminococcus massiliensis TaxID=2086583 RepID=UPI003AB5C77A